MKIFSKFLYFLASITLTAGFTLSAQKVAEISVLAGKPSFDVQPTMWGVFFEDINFAADGGLYAELVKNRSFEFLAPLEGWSEIKEKGEGRWLTSFYSPARTGNPRFLRLVVDAENGVYGLSNEGFRGMGIKKDMQYNFSVSAKLATGSNLRMQLSLVNSKGEILGSSELAGFSDDWKKYNVSLKSNNTDPKAKLRLLLTGKGTIDIDMVSLFPADTWKGRPDGLRNDLVQMIADLKPGFLRFPGGCIVEGRDLANRYQWKTTVGPIDERKLIINRWSSEVQNRPASRLLSDFWVRFL